MIDDFSVAFKVVSERNCPFYAVDDLFVLTSQAVQLPIGHPSCLILVRELTSLLFDAIVPAADEGLDRIAHEIYSCGGCTGLIKFQLETNPVTQAGNGDHPPNAEPGTEKAEEKVGREEEKHEGSVISGQLSELSPSELLQFFHMHQKTGKLVLDVAAGTGRVAFRDGAIIGAKFLEYENKEAVFALLREHRGRFSFAAGIPSSLLEVEDIGDFMMLLMEGIKRMDEEGG